MDVEAKVIPERLVLSVLVVTARLRDISATNALNFKSSGAKTAKNKDTELATGPTALYRGESTLLVICRQDMSLEHPSVKGKSQTNPLSLTNSHDSSKMIDRAKPNPSTRVSEVLAKYFPSSEGSPVI